MRIAKGEYKTDIYCPAFGGNSQSLRGWYGNDDCRSRNEFIEKAIRHYTGYLSAEKNKVVLGEQIQKVVESSVKSSEGRLSNQSFRMAVELAKLQRIIAYYFQMDEETLTELHNLCQREVKSMNGTLSLEDMIK